MCLWDHADIRAERLSIKKSQNILVLAFTNATPTKCRFLIWENRLPLIHMRQLHLGHLRVTTICSIFCSSSRDVMFKSHKMSTNYTSKVIRTCSILRTIAAFRRKLGSMLTEFPKIFLGKPVTLIAGQN